jgi:hypothetical protein
LAPLRIFGPSLQFKENPKQYQLRFTNPVAVKIDLVKKIDGQPQILDGSWIFLSDMFIRISCKYHIDVLKI